MLEFTEFYTTTHLFLQMQTACLGPWFYTLLLDMGLTETLEFNKQKLHLNTFIRIVYIFVYKI